MSVTWNCPRDSWNHDGTFCFKETGVKVTLRLYYVLTIIEKLCRWILLMKIESYIWLMIEPKCLLSKV